MTLLEFVSTFKALEKKPKVIIFVAKQYVPLAFHTLIHFIKDHGNQEFATSMQLDVTVSLPEISQRLHTSFLGQSCLYWFAIDGDDTTKKYKDFERFMMHYSGPHTVIGWTSNVALVSQAESIIVNIPDSFSFADIAHLSILYDQGCKDAALYLYNKVFRIKKTLTLQELFALKNYIKFLGKNVDQFCQQWLDHLMSFDASLFQLAQFFFEKKADQFFNYWSTIKSSYPDQFWIGFFSDQLFKAHFVVAFQGRIDPAYKYMTYGLPFSFLKHDWKLFNCTQIASAHQALYLVDFKIKSGESVALLDNYFIQFFA